MATVEYYTYCWGKYPRPGLEDRGFPVQALPVMAGNVISCQVDGKRRKWYLVGHRMVSAQWVIQHMPWVYRRDFIF